MVQMDNNSITTGTEKFHKDIRAIIETGRKLAYAAVGQTTVATYWQIGCRIVEEEQEGKERAKYGSKQTGSGIESCEVQQVLQRPYLIIYVLAAMLS